MVYDALRPRTIQQFHVNMVENAERQDFVANPQSLWWHFNALSLAQAPTCHTPLTSRGKKNRVSVSGVNYFALSR
jgi:hypothetical protein